jgi:hypothetical protein
MVNACRYRRSSRILALVAAVAASAAGVAAEPGRTPPTGPLRELTTDRPDSTESPFTVDPGHLQLEMDVASFTRDRLDGVRTEEWNVAPFNLRYGLNADLEAGIFLAPYVRVTESRRGGAKTRVSGIGDTTLRIKQNFLGNDGGATAFGVMADLKLPTAADGLGNDRTEAALSLPVAYELGGGWAGAAMTVVEYAYTDRGRRAVWVNTITFARDIVPDLGGFVELTSIAGDGRHVATFNCGLTRSLGATTQLDCGINVGISRTAPDLTVFAGLSRKY